MPPPQLPRNAPRLDVFQPMIIRLFPRLRHDLRPTFTHGIQLLHQFAEEAELFLFNDGQLLDPQEDEAPTVPTEPIAIPSLGNSAAGRGSVASTGASAPPSAVTYSSLNSLPRTGPQSKPQANPSVIATRGNPATAKDDNKKKRPTTVKGAFFNIQYRN